MAFLGQFLASLFAIVALAWIARKFGLGRDIRIQDRQHAQRLADEIFCGFDPHEIALDEAGSAALLCDSERRVILLKLHGAQFAGRLLGPGSNARIWEDRGKTSLEVDSGDRWFGKAFLDVSDPQDWVIAINAAKISDHA